MRYGITAAMMGLFLINSMFLLTSYVASNENDAQNDIDHSKKCIQSWVKGLSKNNPDMKEQDIKGFANYFCSCSFKQNDMVSTATDMNDLRTKIYEKCIPYAALRNALELQNKANGDTYPDSKSLADACLFSFPFDLKKIETRNSLMLFCSCAAKSLSGLQHEKDKLSEEELDKRLYQIAADCSGD